MSDILTTLDHVLDERKQSSPEESYVASLHHNGLNKILEKIGAKNTVGLVVYAIANDIHSLT